MKAFFSTALLALAFLLAIPSANAALITFCPAYGNDSGCAFLITISATGVGSITAASSPSQPTYDGNDDTSVGVINNWTGHTITSIVLSATLAIYGFDGDGPCTAVGGTFGGLPAADCGTGANSYGGRLGIAGSSSDVTFSAINAAQTSGTVNFTQGLAPGQSAWFALEQDLAGATLSIPVVNTVPEPASVILVGCALLGVGAFRRLRRR